MTLQTRNSLDAEISGAKDKKYAPGSQDVRQSSMHLLAAHVQKLSIVSGGRVGRKGLAAGTPSRLWGMSPERAPGQGFDEGSAGTGLAYHQIIGPLSPLSISGKMDVKVVEYG